jgi:hypothetical protein
MSTSVDTAAINWKEVDDAIRSGNAKLTALAKRYNMNTATMRVNMLSHYGNRIAFIRGRKGGIRFANTEGK